MKPYKIESGIKLPPPASGRRNHATQPSRTFITLEAMQSGHSFLVREPLEAVAAAKILKDYAARERQRKTGRQFTTRKSAKGLRIWRTR